MTVAERDGTLTFSIVDDGAGFEVAGRGRRRARLRQHGRPPRRLRRDARRHVGSRQRHDGHRHLAAPGLSPSECRSAGVRHPGTRTASNTRMGGDPGGVAAGLPQAADDARRQLVLVDVGDRPARAGGRSADRRGCTSTPGSPSSPGWASVIRRVASMPSSSPMLMSISTRSGCSSPLVDTASSPDSTSATSSNPSTRLSTARAASRNGGWSSTIMTLTRSATRSSSRTATPATTVPPPEPRVWSATRRRRGARAPP